MSTSSGLEQLPNFSILFVYPPGSTASRQVSPILRSGNSRKHASVTRDERIPFDVGKWTADQKELILQQLRARGEIENAVRSTGGEDDEQLEQDLPKLQIEDSSFESPKNVEDDVSPGSSSTSYSDLDET